MEAGAFNNKVVIITGAGQGIGFEIARQLVLQGATVILNDIDPQLTDSAAEALKDNSGFCVACAGDCGDWGFIQGMVQLAVVNYGRLDIIIANAGITLFGDFFTYTKEAFSKVMQLNLAGTFFLVQAAANQMKQQEQGGSILLTSSVTGHQAHKNLAAYGMSKAAIEMLARNLVIELSEYKININTIAPGATLTERTMDDTNYEKTWSKLTPMGRPGTAGDVANAALFLVSENAKQITGQTLIIDGGWSCISPSPY